MDGNMSITVLPARNLARKNKDEEKPKLRVAAYCRVSTDSEEQATSYEVQIEHYTTYIGGHPDWVLAGIFADDGISGTNTKKREEFNRMIDECMAGNIDMVITKSISRFARNTVDCLNYIRQLKDKNIPVFWEYLEGSSTLKIARGLIADGIKNGAGNEKWHTSNITQILRNKKYIGDALLQKTYTVDFLTKKRVRNNGLMPQYYVENSHEAIIPREIFMQVQEELIRRRTGVHLSKSGKKRNFSSNHCFSNIIICGNCGEVFRRVHWNNRGKKSIVWRCVSRLQNTGLFCEARTVLESTLEQVTVAAINDALCGKDDFLATLEKNVASVLQAKNDETLTEIDRRLVELQTQLVKLASSKVDYEDVAEEIYRLREQKQKVQVESANRDELRKRMADMRMFLHEQLTEVYEYDEKLVRRLVEKVIVYEDRFTVEFKSGVTVQFH